MLQPKSNLSEKWQSSCSVDRAQPKHGFLSAQKHAAAIFICTSMAAERRLSAAQGSNYNVSACVCVCVLYSRCVCVCVAVEVICSSAPPLSSLWRVNRGRMKVLRLQWLRREWKLFGWCSLSLSFSLPRSLAPLVCFVCRQAGWDELGVKYPTSSPLPPSPPPKSIMQTEVVNCPHICMQRVNEI